MPRTSHGVTVANVVSTAVIDAGLSVLTIVNRQQAGTLFVTVDGSTPTIGGAGTYSVMGTRLLSAPGPYASTTVQLISSTAVAYSVEGESS
jgi:hypothetical protein